MSTRKIRLSKKSFRPFFGFLLFAYFVLHLLQGDRGYINLQKLERQKHVVAMEHQHLIDKRQKLEHRVTLLRGPKLDRDLLEEQARAKLGYVSAHDTVLDLRQ